MATLITVGNNNGERRCDEKCYDAKGGVCDCVCGGINHGVGYNTAIGNTQQYGKGILKKIKKENPSIKATIEAIQENLNL